jgi:hypothetical protein
MKIVTLADSERKIVLVAEVMHAAETCRENNQHDVFQATGNRYFLAVHVYRLYLGRDTTHEGDILIGVNTLADQVFTQPPHVTPAKILVLEDEFHIVRRVVGWIDLARSQRWWENGT